MLNKNYEILCKLNLTQNNITVNDVIKAVSYQLKNVATKIIGETINDIQNTILDKFLGTRWNEFDTILIDGTKVKSGLKERGSEIHLTISPVKTTVKNGRTYTEKRLVAFSIGDADKSLKSQLSRYSCDNVIVDGDPSYLNLVKDVFEDATHRRCKWHIPRQVSHLLYMNKEKENSLC